MIPFAITVLSSAFLLFGVQPMLGRYLAPWFGGGASTWTTCLVFFQVLLLGGYLWAHGIARRLRPATQWKVHLAALAASLAFLPLLPSPDTWRPDGLGVPSLTILFLLTTVVGLPYLVLASTGPLMQAWLSRVHPQRQCYRLYALSNIGSLLALLAYPFAIEPTMSLTTQGWSWSVGYVVFVVASGLCALQLRRVGRETDAEPPETAATTPRPRPWFWLACAATGSLLMTATTARVCEDLAGAPLLWTIPLAVYLVTYILCFESDRWYRRAVFLPLAAVALIGITIHLHELSGIEGWWSVALLGGVLFVACMVCHGELARARPAPEHLTWFYVMVAAGGAAGGTGAALIAPVLFADYWEYHVALFAVGLIVASGLHRAWAHVPAVRMGWLWTSGVCCTLLAFSLGKQIVDRRAVDHAGTRSFYGTLHVQLQTDPWMRVRRIMMSGGTIHGMQYADPDKTGWPTAYYGRESGIGAALDAVDGRWLPGGERPRRVGVLGLGSGAVAALAERGDTVRFYEIDPNVAEYAKQHFSFIDESPATVEVVLGDARRVLEDEAARGENQQFDVLCVDAFSGDTIPLHLLTEEALDIYGAHLRRETGILAFHLSNRYVDLLPVVRALARAGDLDMHVVASPGELARAGTLYSVWALLTRDGRVADAPAIRAVVETADADGDVLAWTDEWASVLPVLTKSSVASWWRDAPAWGCFVTDRASVLPRREQDALLQRLRLSYRNSDGRFALMIASIPDKVSGDALQAKATALYDEFDLANAERGAVLVLARGSGQIYLGLGEQWSTGQAEASGVVTTAMSDGPQDRPLVGRLNAVADALEGLAQGELAEAGQVDLASPPAGTR